MEYSGTGLVNQHFVQSPAGILKIAELLFGGGAWGPLATGSATLTGPYHFYFWATAGSWSLVLFTYVLQLFKRTKIPIGSTEKKAANAPNLRDLVMNFAIAVVYIVAMIVFGVYSFSPTHITFATLEESKAIFMIIMAVLAFATHLIHAGSLLVYISPARTQEHHWFWESAQRAPSYQQEQQQPVYANPADYAVAGSGQLPCVQTGQSYPSLTSQSQATQHQSAQQMP